MYQPQSRDEQQHDPYDGQEMSAEDYLRLDRASTTVKYQYLDGRARAMAGGSIAHAHLLGVMYQLLGEQFASGPCHAYNSEVKVALADGSYVYPDVSVSCDISDWNADSDIIHSPHLVVEVLSPFTERDDRGRKFARYQATPGIEEYVLVSSECFCVEVFLRLEDGRKWEYRRYDQPGQVVALNSLDLQLSIDDIYKGLPPRR
ncbi:MAG: Uma2 family endonuclease [Ktedonobacteraceae bacterium]|nr:Uma2 family endonuclease [Ktedonobacteraceae bacterium]